MSAEYKWSIGGHGGSMERDCRARETRSILPGPGTEMKKIDGGGGGGGARSVRKWKRRAGGARRGSRATSEDVRSKRRAMWQSLHKFSDAPQIRLRKSYRIRIICTAMGLPATGVCFALLSLTAPRFYGFPSYCPLRTVFGRADWDSVSL